MSAKNKRTPVASLRSRQEGHDGRLRYINGFAKFSGESKEFYIEQIGMVALGLQEALAQDYDGIIRIAPAIPDGWDFDGTVALRHGVRASLQIRGGVPTAVGLEAKFAQKLKMKSPWPGELVCVSNAETGEIVADATSSPVVEFPAKANAAYRIERASEKGSFVSVDAVPALTFKRLGSVQIGVGGNMSQRTKM